MACGFPRNKGFCIQRDNKIARFTAATAFFNMSALKDRLHLNKSPQLPLYKDKPSAAAGSAFVPLKGRPNLKKVMVLKAFALSVVVYLFYLLISSAPSPRSAFRKDWSVAKNEVRDVFLESWHAYEDAAFGKDVYHPVKGTGENMGPKPLGWIIVDSLDTMLIMDAQDEFKRAKDWVRNDLNYHFDYNVNVFETTIRMLGGLLSAFHLSNDDLFLDRAADLANALIGGFNSPTGLPYSSVNLLSGEGLKNHVDNGASSTAEVATLQLEFKYLAKLTGEELYWKKAEEIMKVLDANQPQDGLVPIYVNPESGKYQGSLIRMGSRGDSYYEYLLKQYLQTEQQEPIYWKMYKESVEGVKTKMTKKSEPNGLTYIGELPRGVGGNLSPKMDHLVCFYGGLLALGATSGKTLKEARQLPNWDADKELDFKFGEELTYTCYKMYADVVTGLSPEIVVFNEDATKERDFYIKPADTHNLQRPETVESLYYLYKLTGDEKYRKWGYEIFQSFIKHTKVVSKNGKVTYSTLKDVTSLNPLFGDNMESFWLAETLKYLYLLFDDEDKIPLDKYVFNTEAHPFPRFLMGTLFKTGWQRSFDDPRNAVKFGDAVGNPDQAKKHDAALDKKNIPKAAPAAKKIDEEVQEEVEKDPLLKEEPRKFKKAEQEVLQALNGQAK